VTDRRDESTVSVTGMSELRKRIVLVVGFVVNFVMLFGMRDPSDKEVLDRSELKFRVNGLCLLPSLLALSTVRQTVSKHSTDHGNWVNNVE
jgi:hypothetical protein